MSRLMRVAVSLVAFAAVSVSSAGAATVTHRLPVGPASNTASVAGSTGVNLAHHTLSVGGVQVSCTDATFDVTTPASTSVTVSPTFTGCGLLAAGTLVSSVRIDVNCEWSFTFQSAAFNPLTGAGTGLTVDVPCQTTVTNDLGCTLHMTPRSNAAGMSVQNVNSAGGNDSSASPWGSRIVGALSGLHYTTTQEAGGSCLVPATGNFSYVGSVYVRSLWGMS